MTQKTLSERSEAAQRTLSVYPYLPGSPYPPGMAASAALGGVHGRGSSPQAQRLDRRGEKTKSNQSGDIRRRYVLWAGAERIPLNEMMLATGLSETTVGRIITAARRDTAYFRNF